MPSFQYFDLVTVSWPKNVSISMFLTNNMLHYVNVTQSCQHEFSFFSTPNANKVFIRLLIVNNISMHQIFYYNYGCYDYEFNRINLTEILCLHQIAMLLKSHLIYIMRVHVNNHFSSEKYRNNLSLNVDRKLFYNYGVFNVCLLTFPVWYALWTTVCGKLETVNQSVTYSVCI